MAEKVTPEQAREIYYAALGRSYINKQLDWTKPRVQHECEMEAWKAVLDDPDTPEAVAALKAYNDAKADLRTQPHTIDRLWTEYCDICQREMEKKNAA